MEIDVVHVVTPLRGIAQVGLHGDQVGELNVQLRKHQEEETEEDGERQVEIEKKGRWGQKETLFRMTVGWNETEPWSACDTDIKKCNKLRALNAWLLIVQLARVNVRVFVVDVLCVMLGRGKCTLYTPRRWQPLLVL